MTTPYVAWRLIHGSGHTNRAIYKRGVVTLTSHRIIWSSGSMAVEGSLQHVVNARKSRNMFKPSRYETACGRVGGRRGDESPLELTA